MAQGKHKDVYRKERGDVPTLLCTINEEPVIVTRREVQGYVADPVFIYVMGVYNYTELWGLPNNSGWANENCDILEAITAIKLEARAIEHEAIENARNQSK